MILGTSTVEHRNFEKWPAKLPRWIPRAGPHSVAQPCVGTVQGEGLRPSMDGIYIWTPWLPWLMLVYPTGFLF